MSDKLFVTISDRLDSLALRVNEVIRQRDTLARHLGCLLATITLPQNERHVNPMLLEMANKIVAQLDAQLDADKPPAFDGNTPSATEGRFGTKLLGNEGRPEKSGET